MTLRALLFVAAATAALAGLFVLLRPPAQPPAPSAPAPAAAVAPANAPLVFEIAVEKGRRVSGPEVLQVQEGAQVVLRLTSDASDELHLHGYDLTLKVWPGATAELAFSADKTGRFEYELHRAHTALGAIEVRPR